MTQETFRTFDIANYLTSKELIAEYLSQVLTDGDTDDLLDAIGNIARATSMTQVARKTGLGRESLYKSLQAGGNPRFDTVVKVLKSFDIQLQAVHR
jgi:probable addiction module antidote protein